MVEQPTFSSKSAGDPHHRPAGILSVAHLIEHTDDVLVY